MSTIRAEVKPEVNPKLLLAGGTPFERWKPEIKSKLPPSMRSLIEFRGGCRKYVEFRPEAKPKPPPMSFKLTVMSTIRAELSHVDQLMLLLDTCVYMWHDVPYVRIAELACTCRV